MVVLSAAVVTKSGKTLVSRQFVEMSRIRVEGLLSAFPKLLNTKNQHTYVETENVRYVYQPMESLYLVLVTNKASNILEDLETLRLLAKVLSEYCRHFNEAEILQNAFELIFAFDEVIALGYRENVSLHQIRTYLEMESVEEQRQEELKAEQIKIAQQMANKKAKELDLKRAQQTAKAAIQGFGSNTTGSGGPGGGGFGDFDAPSGPTAQPRITQQEARQPVAKPAGAKRGMKLGKTQKQQDLLQAMIDEGDIDAGAVSGSSTSTASAPVAAPVADKKPITMTIVEKVAASFNRNSGMESLEIKGDLTLVVNDQNATHVKAKLACGPNKGFALRTHPNINKQLFMEQGVLALKDINRAFPLGAELAVLKWRATSTNEDDAPLVVSVWPSPAGGGKLLVNADYALKPGVVLHDVKIRIGVSGVPNVTAIDGTYKVNAKANAMMWEIDMIDDNNDSGSIEFTVDGSDADVFFPVQVMFTSSKPLCDVRVEAIATHEGQRVPFADTAIMSAEEYVIV